MLKSGHNEKLPWSTPQLLRIKAGSAEAKGQSGVLDDGGKSASDKS